MAAVGQDQRQAAAGTATPGRLPSRWLETAQSHRPPAGTRHRAARRCGHVPGVVVPGVVAILPPSRCGAGGRRGTEKGDER